MDKKLTPLQKELLEKLKYRKKIYWTDTLTGHTMSLKSLVKRGLVEVHNLDRNGDYTKFTFWRLK